MMMKSRVFHLVCVLGAVTLLFGVPGCDDGAGVTGEQDTTGSDTTSNDTTSNGTGGTTQCGPDPSFSVTCQAGQYCRDQDLRECDNGCLSNANCASDQTCIKAAGEDVGSCQNNTSAVCGNGTCEAGEDATSCPGDCGGGGGDREQFCTKLQACDPSVTQAQCDQAYDGTNATCHSCIINANCGDLNNGTACANECGGGGGGGGGLYPSAGVCVSVNDTATGQACDCNGDCQGDICLVNAEGAENGYCSNGCTDFTECPDFWSCETIEGAAGSYCVNPN